MSAQELTQMLLDANGKHRQQARRAPSSPRSSGCYSPRPPSSLPSEEILSPPEGRPLAWTQLLGSGILPASP